jgi:hypothetical protein
MAGKVTVLLNTLTVSDVEAMAPTERRSFAELCRHWARLTERSRTDPWGSGVLAELRQGHHTATDLHRAQIEKAPTAALGAWHRRGRSPRTEVGTFPLGYLFRIIEKSARCRGRS